MEHHHIVLRLNNSSVNPPTTDDGNKFNIITFPIAGKLNVGKRGRRHKAMQVEKAKALTKQRT